MNKFLYGRLAAVSMRKNAKIYLPYILTCIFTVAMFYIMLYLTMNTGLEKMPGAGTLQATMTLGSIVIAIFSVIILLYTNSFLMKRRKKEIGLYNVLGMGKRHIARVMLFETVYAALIALIVGLFCGIVLSKLMLLLLVRLLSFEVPFGFEVAPLAVILTLVLFVGIFFVTLFLNLGRVHLAKPIELLYGGNVGEKEPKTKWLLAIVGLLALGAAYWLANTVADPVAALGWFFIAVLLVILGTYCLFIAGSIALLKILRSNKNYYYKTRHFTAISGMLYRMKQNAAGLAGICILATMVLVMVSTTVSMYAGFEDILRYRYPRNVEIKMLDVSRAQSELLRSAADAYIGDAGAAVSDTITFMYVSRTLSFDGSALCTDAQSGGDTIVYFIPLEDYNRIQNTDETLQPDELLFYSPDISYSSSGLSIGGGDYSVISVLGDFDITDSRMEKYDETVYLVLADEDTIEQAVDGLYGGEHATSEFYFYYGFDMPEASDEEQADFAWMLASALPVLTDLNGEDLPVYVSSAAASRGDLFSVYGGLFFLGLFLGALFIMATVVIMYYKQITEGYDDKKRFEIMQKVGLGRDEIKATIRSQVLTVFFLPLVAAGVHILAAFKMITKILFLLNLTNVTLFAWCTLATLGCFAFIYAGVYALTAKAYYTIVS
jgi:putative ABC transport system permease protein